jgi:hypothetical protein
MAGPVEVVVIGLVVGVLFLPWLALRDLLRVPPGAWRATGRSRLAWAAIVAGVPVLGAAVYLRLVRPQLRAAR